PNSPLFPYTTLFRSERTIASVCDRYLALLARELENPARHTRLFDGVPELLAALVPRETAGRALVGLLTGNLERGAVMKLRSAGLDRKSTRLNSSHEW